MKGNFTRQRLQKFLSYYRPHRIIFAADMFFTALSALAALLFPLLSGYITAAVLNDWNEGTPRRLFWAGAGLLGLVVVRCASNVVYAYFGHAMGAKMEAAMREELFCHYEKQTFAFHARNSVGKLMTVASNDLNGMTELFHHGPEDIMMTLIKFVGAFIILIRINVPLTLIVFAALPILAVSAVKTDKVMERWLVKAKTDLAEMNEQLEDALSGIRTVKAFGNEAYEAEAFFRKNRKYAKSRCFYYKVEAIFYETVSCYPQFLTMLTVFFGALFIGRGALDIPVLITFLLYVGTLAEPISTMLNFMRLFEEGKAGFIRFMDVMETAPAVQESAHPAAPIPGNGEIVFEHVVFSYEEGSEKVLEDVSFRIRTGESVAFVGASGIGKTTVSMLMARFYDASEGRVLVGGRDVKELSFAALREMIGIVQQEVYIFNGTIRENIRYGNPAASDQAVEEAAALANLHEFIQSLEQGYETKVGTKGITLSGGQRQRVSIARLFLKNPRILILDEATSALDYESEQIVQQSIERLMKGRTAVTIAHRLSTVQNADRIFVLGDKGILEQGSHAELLKKGGEYAKLYRIGQ